MKVIVDLHIHSKYARATSKNLSFENLEKYGRMKGVSLLGTGDFQHPLQRKEIEEHLREDENGILWTKTGFPFIWQTEISFMYSQGGRGRAIHMVILSPNKETSDKIIDYLSSRGRLDYDGRPIFGISCKQFTKDMKSISDLIEIIPAHCMTPWFGLFGSKKGFDSLEECFEEEVGHIYAIESGMSADPGMLWRFREKVNIVSFSDSHGFWPWRIAREATVLEVESLTYDNIINAIRTGKGIVSTIETPPEYGRYHWDGHRNCDFSCSPEETRKLKGICPKCGKPLIIGVDYRVDEIAKESKGFKPKNFIPYNLLLPLHELIALFLGSSLASKKTWAIYDSLIEKFGNEFSILLDISKEKMLVEKIPEKLIQLILENRCGKIKIKPGYDGEYGQLKKDEKQITLI